MKTVLITGASRGIGAATARAFAADGWKVAVNYLHSKEKAEALCGELGNGAFPVRADVSRPGEVAAMAETVLSRWGQVDALVCNAGIALPGALAQSCSDEDWERVLSVDVSGVFYPIRALLPAMIRRQSGRIITVSSMWGQVGGACEVAYSAAKGAVLAMSKALAKELGPSGITVNCVAPGVIRTDMLAGISQDTLDALAEETPLGVLGRPEDIAAAILFLAGDGGRFITGQALGVSGGLVIT